MKRLLAMFAACAAFLVLSPTAGAWGPNDPSGDIAIPENTSANGFELGDGVKGCFGAGCPWYYVYNLVSTQFELWHTNCGAGPCEVMICDDGTNDCVWSGKLTATDGLAINSDGVKLTLGAAGDADSYLNFDGNNLEMWAVNEIEVLAPLRVGTLEVDADSGPVGFLNMEISATPGAGTRQSLGIQINSNLHTDFYCEADGSGGDEDCHTVESHSPVWVPSSAIALAANGNFDCASGITRVVGSGGAVTLATDPSINDGDLDGQYCVVSGTDDTNHVTINDATNVELNGGAAVQLDKGHSLTVQWNSADAVWYETARSAP